jgi:GTP-binding protein
VGRPNVGKSSVFNWLAGRRIAIVDPTAGVTRDRIATPIEASDRWLELTDTGGIGIQDVDNLTGDIEKQIAAALSEAAVIFFLVDVRDGVVPLDQEVSKRLRSLDKPVVLVANKCDTKELEMSAQDFFALGWGKPIAVSAHQGRGKTVLMETLASRLPPPDAEKPPAEIELKLAIVGRRNTGKSTFINSLAQAERVIVSEIPGTTRDSIDVRFERDGKTFIAIDTAGVRKRAAISENIEFYSLTRAERSIRRADVVLLFFDPRHTVSRVDKQLAEYIIENHKPAIFVVNKWDLAKDKIHTGKWADYLKKMIPALDYVPMAFITAKDGKNVYRVLNLAQSLHKQAGARVGTSELNRVIRAAYERRQPPARQNRTPRIYYGTQAAAQPPTIILFTNGPELFDPPYIRYLLKTFREQLPFAEVPINLHLRLRGRESGPVREMEEEEKPATKKRRSQAKAGTKRKRDSEEKMDVWHDV